MTLCTRSRRLVALLALSAVLAPLAHAQSPYDCYPDSYILIYGSDSTPNPYPNDALTAPITAERPVTRAGRDLVRAPRHTPEARSAGAARPAGVSSTFCATDYRTQQWGGTAWGPDDGRLAATYDAAGRLLTMSTYHDNGSGFALDDRETFAYNGSGRLTNSLYEGTFGGSTLQPAYRSTGTYDGAGRLTVFLYEEATSSGWSPDERYTLAYGSGPYVTSILEEEWNGSLWVNESRVTFAYTADNRRATSLEERWTGSSWQNDYREQFVYDGAGRLTSHTSESPAGPTGWRPSYRELYAYDGAGLVTEDRSQSWTGSAWQDGGLAVYSYASGRLSEATVSTTNGGTAPLQPYQRERFVYTSGHLAERIQDEWYGAWQTRSRTLYTRDSAARPTQLLMQDAYVLNGVLQYFVNRSRDLFRYDGTVAAEDGPATDALALSVGPNPASASATVRFTLASASTARLTVTDALGRDVLTAERALSAGAQTLALDTARLAPGLYVVHLRTGALVATRRLVVAR